MHVCVSPQPSVHVRADGAFLPAAGGWGPHQAPPAQRTQLGAPRAGLPLLLVQLGQCEVAANVEGHVEAHQDAYALPNGQVVPPEV